MSFQALGCSLVILLSGLLVKVIDPQINLQFEPQSVISLLAIGQQERPGLRLGHW
jgi:hypothetical protein